MPVIKAHTPIKAQTPTTTVNSSRQHCSTNTVRQTKRQLPQYYTFTLIPTINRFFLTKSLITKLLRYHTGPSLLPMPRLNTCIQSTRQHTQLPTVQFPQTPHTKHHQALSHHTPHFITQTNTLPSHTPILSLSHHHPPTSLLSL